MAEKHHRLLWTGKPTRRHIQRLDSERYLRSASVLLRGRVLSGPHLLLPERRTPLRSGAERLLGSRDDHDDRWSFDGFDSVKAPALSSAGRPQSQGPRKTSPRSAPTSKT